MDHDSSQMMFSSVSSRKVGGREHRLIATSVAAKKQTNTFWSQMTRPVTHSEEIHLKKRKNLPTSCFFSLGFSVKTHTSIHYRCTEQMKTRKIQKNCRSPNRMRRVWVSVDPRGFWDMQRNMEPLSSAGTLSRTSLLPWCSSLPSSSRPPTMVQVNMGSGNTSLCGHTW